MRKRIVFHFYYNPSWVDNIMYKVHKTCLSKYSHLFDDAIFNIVLDDVNDENAIAEAKKFIFDTGFKEENTVFYVNYNGEYRDSQTFHDYVVKDLGEYDGMTFFGHLKGLTNVGKGIITDNNVIIWTMAMYYFNLETVSDFENNNAIAYLNPLSNNSKFHTEIGLDHPKYAYYPVGTFFWIKDQKLLQYIKDNNIEYPQFNDRFYGEEFLGNILPFDWSLISSYKNIYGIEMTDFYWWAKYYLNLLYNNLGTMDIWHDFENFYHEIVPDVKKEKKVQIIYLSTDKYKNYAFNFYSRLHYFMPGYKKHIVTVTDDPKMLSDMASDYRSDEITFDFHKMPGNCPYPCVNLSKYAYVDAFMEEGYDYVFYFDSDTYFIDRPASTWDFLVSSLESDEMLFAYHPAVMGSVIDKNDKDSARLSIDLCDERQESKLYDEWAIKDENHLWVISSFFCGKYDVMKKFVKTANDNVIKAMKGPKLWWITEYRVPRLFDETIANRMIYDYWNKKDESIKYNVGYYLINVEGYDYAFPHIIFIQKYNTEENFKNHE